MYIQHMYTRLYTIIHGGYPYIQYNGAQNDHRLDVPKQWSTAHNCMCMVGFTTCLFGAITLLWVATTYEKTSQKKGAQLSSLRIYFGALWLQVSRCWMKVMDPNRDESPVSHPNGFFCCSSTYLCFFLHVFAFCLSLLLKNSWRKKTLF